jgi:pyruvate ferredoxin oxidoreductase gamma subunit/2-oxoisovalerate ferredoxin oxidoreductase gamma subunit
MQEIRFHGRGGQGTVVAGILLAKALFSAGHYVQTFPVFGVERRGAPVEAYLRVGREKILVRSNVYAPDHVMVQDQRLLQTVDVTRGLKKGGWVILNAPAPPEEAGVFSGFRLAWVDATAIAIKNRLGTTTSPIINTAMIGAFARVLQMPPLDMLADTISNEIEIQPQNNIQAARNAYEAVSLREIVPP